MKIAGKVISSGYVGPERRNSSKEERARYVAENPEALAAARSASWLGWFPRPVLVGAFLVALTIIALLVRVQFDAHVAWVNGVNAHVERTAPRLDKIEQNAAAATKSSHTGASELSSASPIPDNAKKTNATLRAKK